MIQDSFKWYALHTRSNFEQKVYDCLCSKTFEAFLPRVQVMSRRKNRREKIFVPMLSGYVFVRSDLDPEYHLEILKTPGVVRMVGFSGRAVPANEEEISSLMILDGTDRTVTNRAYMKKGDRVIVTDGPLKGLIGFYIRHKGQSEKVVVSVELLRRSIAVELEGASLEKMP